MRRITSSLLFVIALMSLAVLLLGNSASADRVTAFSRQSASNPWSEVDSASLQRSGDAQQRLPYAYRTFRVSIDALQNILAGAPLERTDSARNNQVVMALPKPDGSFAQFRIVLSPIMEPELAARFPSIRTFSGQGIDDPTATTRFDLTPTGLHAIVLSEKETFYVEPYTKGNTVDYMVFTHHDAPTDSFAFQCDVTDKEVAEATLRGVFARSDDAPALTGEILRTYRLAVGVTAEYTAAFGGGTVPGALAAITTTVNLADAIYERDVAIRLTLVANETSIIFTDTTTDGYTHESIPNMLTENQTKLDTVIGNANYDIGHVFDGTILGGGFSFQGQAGAIGNVCVTGSKAGGVSIFRSVFPADVIAYYHISHEMGHQFGATHTMNGTTPGCGGARTAFTAYEPGSGSTIMGYRWNCGIQDLRSSDTYFHVANLDQIVNYITVGAGTCGAQSATGNIAPTVSIGPGFTIPRNTPFALTASGSDGNGDSLTYAWEEYDLGPSSPPDSDADGMARPIFRSFLPGANPVRNFPSLTYILNNANVPPTTAPCPIGGGTCAVGEILPSITRTLAFRVTARDNRANGGGFVTASLPVNVSAGAGPFDVTAPNTAVNWNGNSQQTVTWNVANTNTPPINLANVKVSLSTDGGNTFPTTINAFTPNDGSEIITVPNIGTTTARIKVEAFGNIFFDISNVNFTITAVNGGVNKVADFDSDGKTDVSVFRPSNGAWYLLRSLLGFTVVGFGTNGDRPVPGDYDGDGKTDVAVYRPSNGTWYRLNSSDGAFSAVGFGTAGDIPVPGRFDNDNKTDIAVFRPSNGTWYVLRSVDGALQAQAFGANGDIPVSGDYDGDARTDFTVFRPSNGTWYIQQSTLGFTALQFGANGDAPVPGDFDGDAKTDVAVFRPSTGVWYAQRSQLGFLATPWGAVGDQTAAGDYDGDNKTDVAVFRPGTGTFYILQSTSGTLRADQFGTNGDLNIPGAYAP